MDINELFNQFTLFDPAKGQRADLPAVEGNYIVVLKAGCNIPDVLGNFKYTEVSLHRVDYSIYDAIQAGFGKIVFVIRKDFEDQFREKILSKYG